MNLTNAQRRVLLDYLSADDRSHTIRASYREWLAAVPELAALGLLAVVYGTVTHEITDAGRAALDALGSDSELVPSHIL